MSHEDQGSREPEPELLSTASRALLEWRPDGTVVHWNAGAERLFGHPAADAIGRSLYDLLGDAPRFDPGAQPRPSRGASEPVETIETQSRASDGRSLRCRWSVVFLRDGAGEPRSLVAEVEDAADIERTFKLLEASRDLLRKMLDNAASLVFVKDLKRRYIFVNETMAQAFGKHPAEYIGRTDYDLGFAAPDLIAEWHARDDAILRGGEPVRYEESVPVNGEVHHFLTVKFAIRDASGEPVALCAIPTDITSLKRAEAERAALKEQIIASQEAALRELQTPLMPIADQVLAMPIVGSIDPARAAQIMEALLRGITAMRAHTAILDITGVRGINAEAAEALVRAARAARLLGARVVLTGIGPEVAAALVDLRVDIEGIVTRGTFQSGIAFALSM